MKPYQKILVGINYTDSSRHALLQASRIAQESGGSLHAFHAVPPPSFDDHILFYLIDRDSVIRSALDSLKKFTTEILGSNHGVICDVAEGVPHHAVTSFAKEKHIELLVLGEDENAKNPRRAGVFAIKCLRSIEIPVLLVRNQADRPFARLSACVDFSQSTMPVLEHTARMSFSEYQIVEIIHAFCPPWLRTPYLLHYTPKDPEGRGKKPQFREIVEGRLHAAVETASQLLPSTPTPVMLEEEFPEQAILTYLKTSHSELAIVGRWGSGARGLKTDLLGGTAEALIRHAECSVFVVPIIP